MPNQYTISPGTVVGNQSITGDLDVDTGSACPFELGVSALNAAIGINLKKDIATRFNTGKAALALAQLLSDGLHYYQRVSAAGTGYPLGIVFGLPVQTGNVINTGNVTENNVFNTVLRAGLLGPQGVLRCSFYINTTVQGAGTSNVRIKLGATTLTTIGITSVAVRRYDFEFVNYNGAGNNSFCAMLNVSGASPAVGFSLQTIDTTVDQSLQITCQNANNTDSHQFIMMVGHVIPCEVNY